MLIIDDERRGWGIEQKLAGRVALVTGAAQGIGRGTVLCRAHGGP